MDYQEEIWQLDSGVSSETEEVGHLQQPSLSNPNTLNKDRDSIDSCESEEATNFNKTNGEDNDQIQADMNLRVTLIDEAHDNKIYNLTFPGSHTVVQVGSNIFRANVMS